MCVKQAMVYWVLETDSVYVLPRTHAYSRPGKEGGGHGVWFTSFTKMFRTHCTYIITWYKELWKSQFTRASWQVTKSLSNASSLL